MKNTANNFKPKVKAYIELKDEYRCGAINQAPKS
jgi:hypothetical protein